MEQRYITLTDDHFEKLYVRNRSIFAKKEIDAGIEKLATILTAGAALRK